MIRTIFDQFVNGRKSYSDIRRQLNDAGIPNHNGRQAHPRGRHERDVTAAAGASTNWPCSPEPDRRLRGRRSIRGKWLANMLVASGRNRQRLPHELPCHARLAEGGGLTFVNDHSLILKSHS